jgi:hypothetical protein
VRNHGIGLEQPDGDGGEIWLVRMLESGITEQGASQ